MPENINDPVVNEILQERIRAQGARPERPVPHARGRANPAPPAPIDLANAPIRDDVLWTAAAGGNNAVLNFFAEYLGEKRKEEPKATITVLDHFGPRVHPSIGKAMTQHPGQVLYGIELEIENWPVPTRALEATGFNFTEDGSLRNNGYEAVSHPNSKAGILSTTAALWKKYSITERNFSDRTSIHVHANVLNYTLENVKSLAIVYATIEDLIFSFVGEDRRKNIFCVPWTEAGLRIGTINNILEYTRTWQKYTALNLLTMRTQGTVEWRHMEGHCDITRLENWLTIIDEVMNYSRNVNPDELRKIIGGLNTTSEYGAWISTVLPKSHALFTHGQIVKNLTRGVIETKLLLLSK